MKVWIGTDLEGVAGVVNPEHAARNGREHDKARRWLTGEVNAAIRGCAAAGAQEFVVADGHGTCRNLLVDELDPRARLVSGKWTSLVDSMIGGLDASFDAALLIGYHARAGHWPGVLDHTSWSQTVAEVRINQTPVGEAELNAAYAGYLGVPMVMVSGCDVLEGELKQSIPRLHFAQLKRSITRHTADSLLPLNAQALIERTAEAAVRCKDEIGVFTFGAEIELELTFLNDGYAMLAEMVPTCYRTGRRSIAFRSNSYREIFNAMSAMCGISAVAFFQAADA